MSQNEMIGIAAAIAKGIPASAAAAAAAAQTAAEAAAEAAEDVLESIPEDYSTLSAYVSDLKSAIQTNGALPYVGAYSTRAGIINAENVWAVRNDRTHIVIPVTPGAEFKFVTNALRPIIAYFTDDTAAVNGATPPFCTGYAARYTLNKNTVFTGTFPADCNYLYMMIYDGTNNLLPDALIIDGHDYMQTILQTLSGLQDAVSVTYDPVNAIMDVAETYFNIAYSDDDQIVYVSQSGPFSTLEHDGVKAIVCSQFAQACIAGIPYEYSRYVLGSAVKNSPLWWGFVTDGTGEYGNDGAEFESVAPDYMGAAAQCAYFTAKGVCHPYNAAHNGIKPGDLLYYGATADNITHVAICLRTNSALYSVIEATSGKTRLDGETETALVLSEYAYSNNAPKFYVHLGDVLPTVIKSPVNKIATITENVTGTRTADNYGRITEYIYDVFTEPGFYTVNVNATGTSTMYLRLDYSDNTYAIFHSDIVDGKWSAVVYAERAVSYAALYVNTGTYDIEDITVYRGYHAPD